MPGETFLASLLGKLLMGVAAAGLLAGGIWYIRHQGVEAQKAKDQPIVTAGAINEVTVTAGAALQGAISDATVGRTKKETADETSSQEIGKAISEAVPHGYKDQAVPAAVAAAFIAGLHRLRHDAQPQPGPEDTHPRGQ